MKGFSFVSFVVVCTMLLAACAPAATAAPTAAPAVPTATTAPQQPAGSYQHGSGNAYRRSNRYGCTAHRHTGCANAGSRSPGCTGPEGPPVDLHRFPLSAPGILR